MQQEWESEELVASWTLLDADWALVAHVERKSVCIYSQPKTCSASEVAAMLEGLLRHDTSADLDRNYVDTHGASIVGFAFCHLLGFRLLPRLKNESAPPASTGPACRQTPTGSSSDR